MVVGVAAIAMLALAAPASASLDQRGAQLHSLWWDSDNATMDRELDALAAAHANAVRIDVVWGEIEKLVPGQRTGPYVDKLDRFVAGAKARDMKVLANLWGTPCWASTAPKSFTNNCADQNTYWYYCGECWPPINASDYASIVRWLVGRYGTKLAGLEVWNEPNWVFLTSQDKAGDYAKLLRAAYPASKSASRSVPVVAGSLSGSDAVFLAALYAKGIRGYYDALSVHPYADAGYLQLTAFHAAQIAAGDTKPIWVTEFGAPTGSDPAWHVTEAVQAALITDSFAAFSKLSWIKGAFLYALRDQADDPSYQGYNFGVLKRDFTPKAGYQALSDALAAAAAH
jgi:hypothetical protein